MRPYDGVVELYAHRCSTLHSGRSSIPYPSLPAGRMRAMLGIFWKSPGRSSRFSGSPAIRSKFCGCAGRSQPVAPAVSDWLPYIERGKNGALDAAACFEAVSRLLTRFVPVKSYESQAILIPHKTREQCVKPRTMNINDLRWHLAEFGIVAAKRAQHVEELFEKE